MLNSHAEAPGVVASRLLGLGSPLAPLLFRSALSLCPGQATLTPRGGGGLESQKAFVEGASASHLGACSNATKPLLFSPRQLRDKARQMTLRIAETWLGTDKEWKVGKTKIFLKVSP